MSLSYLNVQFKDEHIKERFSHTYLELFLQYLAELYNASAHEKALSGTKSFDQFYNKAFKFKCRKMVKNTLKFVQIGALCCVWGSAVKIIFKTLIFV